MLIVNITDKALNSMIYKSVKSVLSRSYFSDLQYQLASMFPSSLPLIIKISLFNKKI